MKPEDIIVGQLYKRSDEPNCFWLGIGKRKSITKLDFTEKYLVCVQGPKCYIGNIFKTVDEGALPEDWDMFELSNGCRDILEYNQGKTDKVVEFIKGSEKLNDLIRD